MASPRHRDRSNASIFMPHMGDHTYNRPVVLAALHVDMETFDAYHDVFSNRGEDEEAKKKSSILYMAEQDEGDKIIRVLNSNPRQIERVTNSAMETVVHIAARHGKVETMRKVVKFLIHNPLISLADVNTAGDTPLHLALKHSHTTLASYLISKTPHAAYVSNNKGVSPLYLAVMGHHTCLVKKVFEAGKDVEVSTIETLLQLQNKNAYSIAHAAVSNDDLGVLKMLLENLEILNMSIDENERKPISYAAYKGRHKQVSYMLEKFPEYALMMDPDGSFPIHKAAMGGCVDTLAMFISSCPETITWKSNNTHRTILHFAAMAENTRIIEFVKKNHGDKYKDMANVKDSSLNKYTYYLRCKKKSYLMKHGLAAKL